LWETSDRSRYGQRGGPPALQPGQVLLVSIEKDDTGASLWCFPAAEGDRNAVGFKPQSDASRAWTAAQGAVSASLPVLWSSLGGARRLRPSAIRLGQVARESRGDFSGAPARPPQVLDGPSFGLSFALSAASLALDRSVQPHVAASAGIDGQGRVKPVGQITEKVAVLSHLARAVSLLIVAPEEEEEARAAAVRYPGRLEIEAAATVGDAAEIAIGDLAMIFAELGRGPNRSELIAELQWLASGPRGEFVHWTAVAGAARRALEWRGLSEDEEWSLQFVLGVAERHDTNRGALPDPARLRHVANKELRLAMMAHYVQQLADTASSDPDVEAHAHAEIPSPGEREHGHVRLLGALGRLLSSRGQLRPALELQTEAAGWWAESHARPEISYPLSQCYWLSGALDSTSHFETAERRRSRVRSGGGDFDPVGKCYVDLARHRARVALRLADVSDVEALRRLAEESPDAHDHVRWSAIRWAVRLARQLDHPEASVVAERLEGLLREAASQEGDPGKRQLAALFMDLTEIDRHLSAADAVSANRCLDRLRQREKLVDRLASAATSGEVPAFVAQYFPY
jgi:hypothetical protein